MVQRTIIPQDTQKGRPARPQRVKARRRTLEGYVEDLNDARTTLAGFFSVLLWLRGCRMCYSSSGSGMAPAEFEIACEGLDRFRLIQ